ncbi:MAG: NAD(P)H-quinone oxidoreductase subunit 4L, chloroplastic [Chlorobi bacterium OLB5]|nr:MAG: NAD(P)H-quinone oxidoreductase subunit 4L, chloroplastic [Chlorobi bacterium OLB5]
MGIHYYIFVSAAVLGLGLITVISARSVYKLITGVVLVFSASIINIAAFSGFWGFNPEGQILILLTLFFTFLVMLTGIIILGYRRKKQNILYTGLNISDD